MKLEASTLKVKSETELNLNKIESLIVPDTIGVYTSPPLFFEG